MDRRGEREVRRGEARKKREVRGRKDEREQGSVVREEMGGGKGERIDTYGEEGEAKRNERRRGRKKRMEKGE